MPRSSSNRAGNTWIKASKTGCRHPCDRSQVWVRARAFFTTLGITVTEVMTDNGSCYRSRAFADALGEAVKHRRTRPYRPQTNGKVCEYRRW